ncbi:MAG: hypothetical protein M2R45_03084 [Verrucomicrobia subdivision 3 bacterium]|nr:hypothetical protein [Limisphaerales bacterium]MCS1416570.1 hypothetical protein [Limisphaerales bacterium]
MKDSSGILSSTLCLGLALITGGCTKNSDITDAADIESLRAQLRDQVASGELTKEQAIVKLAEATKDIKFGRKDKKGDKTKLPPELEALGKQLKEQMAKGELTEAEVKAKWKESAAKAKRKSGDKGAGKEMPEKK